MNETSPQKRSGRDRISRLNRKPQQTLPRPRRKLGAYLILVAGLISLTVGYITTEVDLPVADNLFLLLGLPFLFLCLVEVGTRALYAVEEYHHLITRYESSFLTLLRNVFYFSYSSVTATILAVAFALKSPKNCIELWFQTGHVSFLTSLLNAYILSILVELKSGPLYDSMWIENSHGLDYGSGMAHSFFHGYLKLIIPKTGNREKHLEELMKDYEAKNNVDLICHKLFMLLPKSLICSRSLMDDVISPSIEESRSLDPKIETVAGVKDRVYKNSVYKIKRGNDRIYVAAEYATPLRTFTEVLKHKGAYSDYYNKHKSEILLQFYLTLQQVLNEHEDCTNFVELIYYDDKDENGNPKDVGEVLLQRIRKLERRKRQLETP